MTSILSSISGYFSKPLILGTFLPVTIFIVLTLLFLVPLLPSDLTIFTPLEGLDKQWKVVAISFVAIVISGLLYNMNIPILRMYEGYPWRNSWIGSWLTNRHVARFEAAQSRIEAMRAVLRAMEAAEKDVSSQSQFVREVIDNWKALGSPLRGPGFRHPQWLEAWHKSHEGSELDEIVEQWKAIRTDLLGEFSAYRIQLKHSYPDGRGLILPTRLGNVIRSFEYYSDREYGIDSIEIWPRLVAIIPNEYAVAIDDTKTTFDFMMNCSLLSVLLALSTLIVGLLYPAPLLSISSALYWIIKITSLVLLSYFFYRLSINRADSWGSLIKSSFDLYRWDLLKKLGYQQEPKRREDERDLWGEISRQMIYGDRFNRKLLSYAEAPAPSFPCVHSEPPTRQLEITRGVKPNPATDVVTVYLRVKNTDSAAPAVGVIVTDMLSEDLDFEWSSAKIDDVEVRMSGTNPYKFVIGDLPETAETILTYNAIPRKRDRISLSLI